MHQGYIPQLGRTERETLCEQTRNHLCNVCGLSTRSYPMLEHDVHAREILRFFVSLGPALWHDEVHPEGLQFSITVLDRWNRQLVHDIGGDISELVETNPVSVEALDLETDPEPIVLLLYCYTFKDGAGYHYDWVSTL